MYSTAENVNPDLDPNNRKDDDDELLPEETDEVEEENDTEEDDTEYTILPSNDGESE